MQHGRVGQFRRVSAHIHGTVDGGHSVWRAVGDTSCGSVVRLLPEAFAVDETSKQITHSLTFITFQCIPSFSMCVLVYHPCRVTMQGGCLNLTMGNWTTTKVTVSATAERRLQVAPITTKYYCYYSLQHPRHCVRLYTVALHSCMS